MKFLGTIPITELKKRSGKAKGPTTHISLFTGAGGLDLGFAAAGIETRVMVEFDKSCCRTLRANWHWEELKKRTKSDGRLQWKNKKEFLEEGRKYKKKIEGFRKKNKPIPFKVEIEAPVASWYQEREPVIIEKDIKLVTSEEILKAAELEMGECSVLSGGAPCQGFSMAGERMIDDPRNSLFKEMVRIIRETLPRAIMFENVKGLQSMNQGKQIKEICEEFSNSGYNIAWKILDAADYGVPQHRERIILIGTRIDAMVLTEEGKIQYIMAAQPGEIQYPEFYMKKYGRKLGIKEPDELRLQALQPKGDSKASDHSNGIGKKTRLSEQSGKQDVSAEVQKTLEEANGNNS